jgi:hypothetical protein
MRQEYDFVLCFNKSLLNMFSISRVSFYPLLQAPDSGSRLSCLGPTSLRHHYDRMCVVVLAGPYRAYPLHFVDRRDSTPRRQKSCYTVNYGSSGHDCAAWRTDLRNHLGDLPHM